jgi:hypothetical protein
MIWLENFRLLHDLIRGSLVNYMTWKIFKMFLMCFFFARPLRIFLCRNSIGACCPAACRSITYTTCYANIKSKFLFISHPICDIKLRTIFLIFAMWELMSLKNIFLLGSFCVYSQFFLWHSLITIINRCKKQGNQQHNRIYVSFNL